MTERAYGGARFLFACLPFIAACGIMYGMSKPNLKKKAAEEQRKRTIYLSPELDDYIADEAELEVRSFAGQIEYMLSGWRRMRGTAGLERVTYD